MSQLTSNPQPITPSIADTIQSSSLRFIVCGSVDDGKSTLIGRLLYDSNKIYDDLLSSMKKDTKSLSRIDDIDFSLLVDGLKDEREQGITIDLSYRYFSSPKRRYIVIDAPGHEQYTKNMAAGASLASLGVVLVDATKGILTQTIRHTYILYLMGIRDIILCVNKMDLVDYSNNQFKLISQSYNTLLNTLDPNRFNLYSLPISATLGDNIFNHSQHMKWYDGPTLYDLLEQVEIHEQQENDAILPVQYVSRPNSHFRGYMGALLGGQLSVGEEITVLPSNQNADIQDIIINCTSSNSARANEAITLVLNKELSLVRGDLILKKGQEVKLSDQFQVRLLALFTDKIFAGRTYIFKFGHNAVLGSITNIINRFDLNTQTEVECSHLNTNDFGICSIFLTKQIPFKPYRESKSLGSFIIIDRITKDTVAVGMILNEKNKAILSTSPNKVTPDLRALIKQQKPCLIWFTGLPCAGKTTIANLVEAKLFDLQYHTYLIDAGHVRRELNADLGFTADERIENIRRISAMSKFFIDAGLITLVAAISPFGSERMMVRDTYKADQFIEVYVKASIETCKHRDKNNFYGKIEEESFVIDEYEPPINPNFIADTEKFSAEALAEEVVSYILKLQES